MAPEQPPGVEDGPEWGRGDRNFGGPFAFFVGTYTDLLTDRAANELAAESLRRKIRSIVTDPATAEKLVPTEPGAPRPVADSGYVVAGAGLLVVLA